MDLRNKDNTHNKVKVMFIAWGYSIHAERRIRCFADDKSFDVSVISTYNYIMPNVKTICLRNRVSDASSDYQNNNTFNSTGSLSVSDSWKSFKRFLKRVSIIRVIKSIAFDRGIIKVFLDFIKEIISSVSDYNKIRMVYNEIKPNTVFFQTLLYPCYLGLLLSSRAKKVITFWNGDLIWWAKHTGIERLFKKQIVLYGVRKVDAITVNSVSAYNICVGYGVEKEKINIIRYPGIDREKFKPLPKENSKKVLEIVESKVVLCPRGLGSYLNSDIIVQAAEIVVNKYPDTLFVFLNSAGENEELERHMNMVKELGIEKRFRWDGQKPWQELPVYYSSSDVMVSISSNDSLPNSMLEAMACGIPVIMGDIPQIRDVIVDNVNGILIETRNPVALANAILKVFENKNNFIENMINNNHKFIENEFDGVKNIKLVKDLVYNLSVESDFCRKLV